MKEISEKAKEYGYVNPVIYYDADGNTYDDFDKPASDFEAGAKKGYQIAIDKACEWLKSGGYFVNNTETEQDFRKAMEGEE